MSYRKTYTTIKGKKYTLFIADTAEKRKKGLNSFKNLPFRTGMLFVYSTDVDHKYEFDKIKMPLTVIFLDKNMNPIEIFHTKIAQKEKIKPKNSYRYVIEIPRTNIYI